MHLRLPSDRSFRASPRLEILEARDVPSTLLVDDSFTAPSKGKFQTIQAAVDAAQAGDTILVAAGTYTEQVTVPAGKDRLTIEAKQPQHAVIAAPATLTGTHAIVRINGADGVTVEGFVITGNADWGVQVDAGGSATITGNRITAIRHTPLDGIQAGVGVLVGGRSAEGSTPADATVTDNTIDDYQKGGVVVVNDGTHALIADNKITGVGPTGLIAQNGVQVSRGADAVVSDNAITGNAYTGPDEARGVIVFGAGGAVAVAGNKLVGNQDGILVMDTIGVAVVGNRVDGSLLDGIILSGAAGALVAGNRVEDSARDGIVVEDSTGSLITMNRVDESGRYGFNVTGASSGNVIFSNKATGSGAAGKSDDSVGPNLWFLNDLA
jgi:parallel beta-helix repeat protein